MDKIDKQILEILQENARTPLKSIAEQVFSCKISRIC